MSGRDASAAGADAAHDNSVGQPHTEAEGDVIVAAEKGAAQISSPAHPLGEAGPRFNRASPFMIGMAGAAGVAVTYGGVELLVAVRGAVILIVVAGFVAIGLEPAVSWLVRHRFPRWVPRGGPSRCHPWSLSSRYCSEGRCSESSAHCWPSR